MYQEMVNDLQKRQRLDSKNVEKQAKITNLQGEVHLMENRYKMCMKDLKNLIGEMGDLGEHSKDRGSGGGDTGAEDKYSTLVCDFSYYSISSSKYLHIE